MQDQLPHKGMSLREGLRLARALGCSVEQREEWLVRHPTWPKTVRVHYNRKDVSAKLRSRLQQLVRVQRAASPPWGAGL